MSRESQGTKGDRRDLTRLDVHVQPRAERTEVVGWYGDAVKIRLAAPPIDGAANDELVAFLADELGVARSSVEIVAGRTSRRKRVAVDGVKREEALDRLGLDGSG
jgi:uncharacterized protein (TIGR00251 family)